MKRKEHIKSLQILENPVSKVDKKQGIIQDVVIVQEGADKNNGYFTPEFLNDLIDAGNNQSQGVKCRFDHPNMCKSSLGTFLGRYKNFRALNDDDKYKVIADLHLDEITKRTQVEGKGISMHDYVTEMAANNADVFGNSIHFTGKSEYEEKEINGKKKEVEVYTLNSFIASDLVDMPAATDSLFKSSEDLGVKASIFLKENPQIFELIEKDVSIVENFIKEYKNQSKTKNNMNFLKKLKKSLGTTKDVDLTLADGKIITVVTDGEEPSVGDEVNDENGQALEDGEYVLADGRKLTVADGKISNIAPVETPANPQSESEVTQSLKEVTKAMEEIGAGLVLIASSLKSYHKRNITSAPLELPPQNSDDPTKPTHSLSVYDQCKNELENNKKQTS